jgi:hypothetical protein
MNELSFQVLLLVATGNVCGDLEMVHASREREMHKSLARSNLVAFS